MSPMTTLELVSRYFNVFYGAGLVVVLATGAMGIIAFRRKRLLKGLNWLGLGLPLAFACLLGPKLAAFSALMSLASDQAVAVQIAPYDDPAWRSTNADFLRRARRSQGRYGSQPSEEGYRMRLCERAVGDCQDFSLQRDSRSDALYWLMLQAPDGAQIPLGFVTKPEVSE